MGRRKKDPIQQAFDDIIIDASMPFEVLGITNPPYSIVYRRKDNCEIISLTFKNHNKPELLSLAPLEFWQIFSGSEKMDPIVIQDKLSMIAHTKGKFHMDKIRGYGAWMDNGRPIYNNGEIISGKPISEFETKYYYRVDRPITDQISPTIQPEIKNLIRKMGFSEGEQIMFGGWCVIAPICGALRWRPHIWITADHGAGKSVILDRIVKPLVGHAMIPSSNTTEAGIRQGLNSDVIPIVFDEAEGKTQTSHVNMAKVLELARKSSGNNNSITYKGTPGGKVFAYIIQSMFCFASINPPITEASDESRISVLEYERLPLEQWNELEALINTQLTEKNCSALRNHVIQNMANVMASCDVVFSEINTQAGNARLADQYSPLIAGWWHIDHIEVIDKDSAGQLINLMFAKKNSKRIENNGTPDSQQCLEDIMTIALLIGGGKQESIRSLLMRWINTSFNEVDENIKNALNSVGVSLTKNKQYVVIHERNTEFRRLLSRTPWITGIRLVVGRLPGVETCHKTYIAGKSVSTLKIPIDLVIDYDDPFEVETQKEEDAPW
jgi:putative DNA primase/helicase